MSFIGPSYTLRNKRASVQRTVNMVPVPLEPGNERAPWVLRDVPGLSVFFDRVYAPTRITVDGRDRIATWGDERVTTGN